VTTTVVLIEDPVGKAITKVMGFKRRENYLKMRNSIKNVSKDLLSENSEWLHLQTVKTTKPTLASRGWWKISSVLTMATSLFFLLCTLFIVGEASSPSRRISTIPKFPLPGVLPDPFVALAPLIIGVVCQDAVLLLAVHTSFSQQNNDESILLFADGEWQERHDGNETIQQQQKQQPPNMDLPRSYRGPFRIYPLDASGTAAMVCAGWRADGQYLAEYLQSVDREQVQMYGEHPACPMEYGSFLASQASLRMAVFAKYSGYRPLSTCGLLASCSNNNNNDNDSGTGGALWLVDATGAYRVRAHAVGAAAGPVNEILQKGDWTKQKCADVARDLLGTMLDGPAQGDDGVNRTKVDVPQGSLVEMVAVGMKEDRGNRRLKRLFASTLFGRTKA
jgi:20S proteasome alpha/beta subunit